MTFTKILNLFVPPILTPTVLKKIFGINKKNEIKEFIKFETNFYTRQAFINKAISNFKHCNYLEIGVANNRVFNCIPLKLVNKFGVDPNNGGNFRMTSDEFFQNNEKKFDVIFIDGLHHYEQCQKDCINSIKSLNKNGIILLHDMLPQNRLEQIVPRKTARWTGDVWKVAVELMHTDNVEFRVINIDHGIGVLKITDNTEYKKMPELKKADYDVFLKYYKKLKIINSEEGLDFLNIK